MGRLVLSDPAFALGWAAQPARELEAEGSQSESRGPGLARKREAPQRIAKPRLTEAVACQGLALVGPKWASSAGRSWESCSPVPGLCSPVPKTPAWVEFPGCAKNDHYTLSNRLV